MAKRGHNEGSLRRRSDGRWEARITIGGRQRSFYASTREQANRRMQAAVRNSESGLPRPDGRLTVGEFLQEWLENSVRPSVRASTYVSYESHVRLYLSPSLGKVTLVKLTPTDVQRLLNELLETGLSAQTVVHVRATLRRALAIAVKWGLVARNVAALVDPPRVPRFEPQLLATEQIRTFLDGVAGDRLEALYYVAVALGMRQGEILGLHWDDVDLGTATLTVRNSLQKVQGEFRLGEPKTKRGRRSLTVPKTVCDVLRRHRARQNRWRRRAGDCWSDWGLVFTTRVGTPLDGCNVTHEFQAKLTDLGLPRQRFHDLRHACATFLLAQGVSPRVVMDTLGHSQISVTMDTYTHVLPELRHQAAAAMERLLRHQ